MKHQTKTRLLTFRFDIERENIVKLHVRLAVCVPGFSRNEMIKVIGKKIVGSIGSRPHKRMFDVHWTAIEIQSHCIALKCYMLSMFVLTVWNFVKYTNIGWHHNLPVQNKHSFHSAWANFFECWSILKRCTIEKVERQNIWKVHEKDSLCTFSLWITWRYLPLHPSYIFIKMWKWMLTATLFI